MAVIMKTIRLRNRALVLLGIGVMGMVFLVRELAAAPQQVDTPLKPQQIASPFQSPNTAVNAPEPPGHQAEDLNEDRKYATVQPGVIKSELRPPSLMDKKHRKRISAIAREVAAKVQKEQPAKQYSDFGEQAEDQRNVRRPPMKLLEEVVVPAKGAYPNIVNGRFIPGHRIVHFDLKGAAPRVAYFKEVFQLLKDLGATGLLLEWEDMFPFTGRLAAVRNGFAYSEAEVKQILGWAVEFQLDIIPLVQTFGHLEYILKLPQFARFRQVDRYPQVICMGDEDAVGLVKEAVDQVMAIHSQFPLSFFHIGADEAFQIGMCQADQKVMREELQNSRERLMLRHIARISQFVRDKYHAKVLMWHDMLNNVDAQLIKEYQLGALAEPVVWAYAENLNEYLMPDMWDRFGEAFPHIWGASSYKGADGPARYWSNVPHYLQNHLSWVQQMSREYQKFKEFRGLILTGWQRYDHFAGLCEILPVGLPSAAINLQTIVHGQFDAVAKKEASRLLGCSSTFDVDSSGVGAYCSFPGSKVYQAVQQLKVTLISVQQNLHEDYQVQGWLSPYNMRHNFSSAWYLDQIMDKLSMYHSDLSAFSRSLREELSLIFFPDMVDEWMMEYVEPEMRRLDEMAASAKRIASIRTFPPRPFRIDSPSATWKSNSSKPHSVS